MDGWKDRWVDGQKERWVDRQVHGVIPIGHLQYRQPLVTKNMVAVASVVCLSVPRSGGASHCMVGCT